MCLGKRFNFNAVFKYYLKEPKDSYVYLSYVNMKLLLLVKVLVFFKFPVSCLWWNIAYTYISSWVTFFGFEIQYSYIGNNL